MSNATLAATDPTARPEANAALDPVAAHPPKKDEIGELTNALLKGSEVLAKLQDISKTRDVTPMDAAEALGDPEQTAALEKFTQGNLSYSEMRALCG